MNNQQNKSDLESVLHIGEVYEVRGNKVLVKIDKEKNSSHLPLNGKLIQNISVNSFVEIKKGFSSLIGKVEEERIEEVKLDYNAKTKNFDNSDRFLVLSIQGCIDSQGIFTGGLKELPLLGNKAFILSEQKIKKIYSFSGSSDLSISVAKSELDGLEISLPVDGLFNSHIAIFGNTGSGKSNTLASLYTNLFSTLRTRSNKDFKEKTKYLFFDFNGEYTSLDCLSPNKKVYNLSTRVDDKDRIPIFEGDLFSLELISILSDAKELTQKPFINRTLEYYKRVMTSDNTKEYIKNSICYFIDKFFMVSDKHKSEAISSYFANILSKKEDANGQDIDILSGLDWFNGKGDSNSSPQFRSQDKSIYYQTSKEEVRNTEIYKRGLEYKLPDNPLERLIHFLYLQLINDIQSNRVTNEHIFPVINRLKSRKTSINKVFEVTNCDSSETENIVVVNMNDCNLELKKIIPLLLSKRYYDKKKNSKSDGILNIIIDEAHNILSNQSSREGESWKNYRLETFEEIIKEGRKFGIFVTISSQRPSDISSTIISQAHNYFIHRLVNNRDLESISNAISYIDRVSEKSIPTLPVGTCIFSGVLTQLPIKLNVNELDEMSKPQSNTIKYAELLKSDVIDAKPPT